MSVGSFGTRMSRLRRDFEADWDFLLCAVVGLSTRSSEHNPSRYESMQRTPELIDRWNACSYSVYNAVDKAPVVALGTQHGILTSAYGELRVSTRSSLHRIGIRKELDGLVLPTSLLTDVMVLPTLSSQPITSSPNGPADIIGKQITDRLSKDYGKEVTYAQMIFSWLKSIGVVAVT